MTLTRCLTQCCLLALLVNTGIAAEWVQSANTDRPGGDYSRIEMQPGQMSQCRTACKDDSFCRSWTWVRKGIQGDDPVCYLKSTIPEPKNSNCCTSGSRISDTPYIGTREPDTDRPGGDYKSQKLPANNIGLCERACSNDENCLAYTLVKPAIQGKDAVCYLKDRITARVPNAECCTSGVSSRALKHIQRDENSNRPGSDYRDFEVVSGGEKTCASQCRIETNCKAYTYVKAWGVSGLGHCWLKDEVPNRINDNCCHSGVKKPGAIAMRTFKVGTDAPGSDISLFIPRAKTESAQRGICADACGVNSDCRMTTFVKAGIQGDLPRCYLKDGNPQGAKNRCCSTAVKDPGFIVKPLGENYVPPVLDFQTPSSTRRIEGRDYPAHMPMPNFPERYRNCSAEQQNAINTSWALAHYYLWRGNQLLQQISASSQRATLWELGFTGAMRDDRGQYANWSPRAWWGTYEPKRFRRVRDTLNKVWIERFLDGKVGLQNLKVWCRGNTGLAPCNTTRFGAHSGVGTIDFCPSFFRSAGNPMNKARFIIHEMFHWTRIPRSGGQVVSDRHDFWRSCSRYVGPRALYGDDAAFLGMNGGCRDWNHNRAVRTVDTYAWFAATLGQRVLDGEVLRFPPENVD